MASYASKAASNDPVERIFQAAQQRRFKLKDGESMNPGEGMAVVRYQRVGSSNPKSGHSWSNVPIYGKMPAAEAPQQSKQEEAEAPYVPPAPKPFDSNTAQEAANRSNAYLEGLRNPAFTPHLDSRRGDFFSNLFQTSDARSQHIQATLPAAMRADAMQSIGEFTQATNNAVAGMRTKATDVASVFDPDKRFGGQSLYAKLQDDLRKAGNIG